MDIIWEKLEKRKKNNPFTTDIIIVEKIMNPGLSKIFLYEKCANSDEILSMYLQISYPNVKTIYY